MADDWGNPHCVTSTRKPPSSEVMQSIITAMQGVADDRSAALLSAALTEGAIISRLPLFCVLTKRLESSYSLKVARSQTLTNASSAAAHCVS